MNPKISYKNIIKASLATVVLVTGVLALLIWIFGNKASLQTEIVRAPNFSNFEEFKKVISPAKTNLTSDVSKVLAREMAQLNPQGPITDEFGIAQIGAINAEDLVDRTIQEGLASFSPEEIRYRAEFAQIKSTSSNIKERQAKYFEEINNLINLAFKDGETINYSYFPQTNFPAIIKNYEKALSTLYKVETPSDLLHYHINLINLLGTHKNIYAVLSNFEEDPLQAYLTADFGLQVEKEIVFLVNDMNQYIEDNKIFES